MAAEEVYFGTWRIVECVSLAGTVETTGIEGTEFVLDEGGDVSWKLSEDAEDALPFFNCETYEVILDRNYAPKAINFIGTYAGLEVNFKVEVSDDLMLLTYERCCMLQCQKVSSPDPKDDVPFSFHGALEEGYFSDVTIRAANGVEFAAHTTILRLATPYVDWTKTPTPLSGLPEDVVRTSLHYIYCECLPRGLAEDTARDCIKHVGRVPDLAKFVKLCETFLKNTALKQQITSLVTDMHASADRVIELFSGANIGDEEPGSADSSIVNNPAKLCYVVKQALREEAVALSKLLILCDLFSRRKSELSREERHEIIKYAKSRVPVFMRQWEKFLAVCQAHTTSLSNGQRQDIASYLVPEIEQSLDIVTEFVTVSKAALEQVISGSETEKTDKSDKPEKSKKGNVTDVLTFTLKNALHVRELKKLKKLHDRFARSFFQFMLHKESFSTMSHAEKVRSVAKLLEQLVDAVHIGQTQVQEWISAAEAKLTWRDWKYIFKLTTSKISWGICKVLHNKQTVQPLINQACDMVHREQFAASLTSLGLRASRGGNPSTTTSSLPGGASPSYTAPQTQKTKYIQLSSVESLCIPPYARDSASADMAVKLLRSQKHTDLVFEIVLAHDIGDTVIDHTGGGAPVERTDPEREVETYRIPAHRVIIAARCDWFRRALLSGMRESIDRKIVVHDTHPELFKLFLEYLYSGQLDLSELSTEQLADMMSLADRYDTIELKSQCEYSLYKHHVDDETALYLLSFGDQLNAKSLKEVCLNYVLDHPVLTSSDVFHDLPEHLQLEVETLSITALESHPRHSSLHPHAETPSSSISEELDEMMSNADLNGTMNAEFAMSSSSEDLLPPTNSAELHSCIGTLQGIVGDTIPHEELIRAALAADCDANRALNFLFA